tara:strand:- start:684 stop:872 length:189 start_codon:yes stop_codon:yes gene_type:complete
MRGDVEDCAKADIRIPEEDRWVRQPQQNVKTRDYYAELKRASKEGLDVGEAAAGETYQPIGA